MKYLTSIAIISSLLLAFCAVWATAAPLFAPQPGILVLKNGRVIEGGILREGDRYIVTLGERGEQGELKIPVADVTLFCRDRVEAYQHKREAIRQLAAKPHLDLAEWCISQGLLDRAADEIVTARTIDPRESRLAFVERRLKIAAEPIVDKQLPQYALPPTQDDIAATIQSLPGDVVRQFTSTIEPILLSRCATTACHGPSAKSDYHLIRPDIRHVNTTRETQRNLYSSIAQVPATGESSLLRFAQAAHGNSDRPALDQNDRRQIEQLAAWVELIQRNPAKPERVQTSRDSGVRQAKYEEPIDDEPAPQIRRLPSVKDQAKPIPVPNKSSTSTPSARDPFDPEIFNQQTRP